VQQQIKLLRNVTVKTNHQRKLIASVCYCEDQGAKASTVTAAVAIVLAQTFPV
jgi:hypothetical protein